MRLVASLVVRNELGRYLEACVGSLLEFCDAVMVLDDASDDGTREWLTEHEDPRLHLAHSQVSRFFVHEGRTRQALLDETLALAPTHVLPIDADELVSDGAQLRARIEASTGVDVWTLALEEIWKADQDRLLVREDGGWGRGVGFVWKVPSRLDARWRIMDRKLACRRVPPAVFRAPSVRIAGVEVLHFGWADESDRRARVRRYEEHDRGRFHSRAHLASILWPDARVTLRERRWPSGAAFHRLRPAVLA